VLSSITDEGNVMKIRTRTLGIIAAGAAAFFLFGAPPAFADNGPHIQGSGTLTTDGCAGCHRAHTAKATGLLKTSEALLCTTCHSAGLGALTDVMAGMYFPDFSNGSQMLGLRGGGFVTAALDTKGAVKATKTIPTLNAGLPVTSAHSYDGSAQTAWGSGTTGVGSQVNLSCTSCHDPHGNGNYRILRPIATGGVGPAVNVADAAVKTYSTQNYWAAQDSSSTSFIASIGSWCTQCHSRYLSSDAETNTGDAIYTYRHMSNDNTPGGPNCIQCHVAHGSNAAMTGTESSHVPLPGGAAAPAGDSRLLRLDNRGTCVMCHNK
jgi:predicted CXXCH cytochrome family protein